MSGDRVLTTDVVVFLFEALLAGRLSREAACTLVSPWVVGDFPFSGKAEQGAQLLHGFDVVREGSLTHHASVVGPGAYELSDEGVRQRCREWLDAVN